MIIKILNNCPTIQTINLVCNEKQGSLLSDILAENRNLTKLEVIVVSLQMSYPARRNIDKFQTTKGRKQHI